MSIASKHWRNLARNRQKVLLPYFLLGFATIGLCTYHLITHSLNLLLTIFRSIAPKNVAEMSEKPLKSCFLLFLPLFFLGFITCRLYPVPFDSSWFKVVHLRFSVKKLPKTRKKHVVFILYLLRFLRYGIKSYITG